MHLKVPLSPKATIDRGLARAVAAQGLWGGRGRNGAGPHPFGRRQGGMVGLPWSDPATGGLEIPCRRCGRNEGSVVRGRDGRRIAPGFCEGEGVIEVEAGELIGDLVAAVADACASA